jgi:adenine-specific DNA methylase
MQCYNKSQFGLRAYVKNAMTDLIDNLDATKIAFHYNSNGILGKAELVRLLMNKGGSLTVYKYLNRNYKPNSNINNDAVVDYLFFVNRKDKRCFKEVWL